MSVVDDFRKAMLDCGIKYTGTITPDKNAITRFTIDGDRTHSLTGWYILHTDGIAAGEFGCWKRGVKQTWCAKSENTLTDDERRELAKRREIDQTRRAEEQKRIYDEKSLLATQIWESATPCENHSYLTRKGVKSYDLRVARWSKHCLVDGEWKLCEIKDALIIPIRESKNRISSLQAIFPDSDNLLSRDKDFLSGGKKSGCFFVIGTPTDKIVFCEGYATGATIHEATGYCVIVCFDSGNLEPVAKAFRKSFPKNEFIIAGDNDRWTTKPISNPGATRATETSHEVKGIVRIPQFDDLSEKPTDYNDMHRLSGLQAVADSINGIEKKETINPPSVIDVASIDIFSPLFDTNSKGKPLSTIENMAEILRRIDTTVRYNVINKKIELLIPGSKFSIDNYGNASLAVIMSWVNRFRMPTGNVADYLVALADENLYNPVANWVTSKEWDGKTRLNDFYETVKEKKVIKLEDGRSLKQVLMMRWMVSAVAAAFNSDGIEAQGVLVLQGAQNLGKTRWMMSLAPKEMNVTKEGVTLNTTDKDSVMQCVRNWIVELGELDATFRRSDIANLKSFITKGRDILRRPFAPVDSEFARRTVFFGSVNPRVFLHDDTGNRRYWTIECESVNSEHGFDMQQVWAEVYQLYKMGIHWRLDVDEMAALNEHNENFTSSDPVHDIIDSSYEWTINQTAWCVPMSATDICLKAGMVKPTRAEVNSASSYVQDKYKVKTQQIKGIKKWMMPPMAD